LTNTVKSGRTRSRARNSIPFGRFILDTTATGLLLSILLWWLILRAPHWHMWHTRLYQLTFPNSILGIVLGRRRRGLQPEDGEAAPPVPLREEKGESI